jgi:hypothetical protein
MEPNSQIIALLEEMRDIQRDHVAEYRRISEKVLSFQETAVARQGQVAKLYRSVVTIVGILVVGFLVYAFYYSR